jgi:hypothetical protein
MLPKADIFRIVLSPLEARDWRIEAVWRELAPKAFTADQLCLLGAPSVMAPLASSLDTGGRAAPELVRLIGSLAPIPAAPASAPMLASVGPIARVVFERQAWWSSMAAAGVRDHLDRGDVVLAANARDHDQFVHAANVLLRHGSGNLSTHIFYAPALGSARPGKT